MGLPYNSAVETAGRDRSSVRLAIGRAAQRTGADFTYLLNQAKSESGLNPYAKASTSSAAGLYQFIDQSWLGVLKQHGEEHGYGWAANAIKWGGRGWTVSPDARQAVFALRNDPEAASLMAGEFAQDNKAGLQAALGREPGAGDLYFAHFLGLQGATRFLRAADASPNAPAASLFPREAAANRSIFYTRSGEARSLSQVYRLMAKKVDGPALPDGAREAPLRIIPDRIERPLQMASIDSLLNYTGTPLSKEPPAEVMLVDLPASVVAKDSPEQTMLAAAADPTRIDVLRPSPKYAALAYLMVATPFREG